MRLITQIINLFDMFSLYSQKFENRTLAVLEPELSRWRQLNIYYMSEESDDLSDCQTIVIHPFTWRSARKFNLLFLRVHFYVCFTIEGLNDFLQTLDQRYEDKVKKDGTAMAKKTRRIGQTSPSPPPDGAPDWAISSKWRNSQENSTFTLPFVGNALTIRNGLYVCTILTGDLPNCGLVGRNYVCVCVCVCMCS